MKRGTRVWRSWYAPGAKISGFNEESTTVEDRESSDIEAEQKYK